MATDSVKTADSEVVVVGLGLHLGQLTREVEAVLSQSDSIFFIHPSATVHAWIRSLDPDSVDLSHLYKEGTSRTLTYRKMAASVVRQAQSVKRVALALYGHPLLLSTLTRMVLDTSDWLGIRTQVVPGISSIDAIMADLRLDPGEVALQLQEATDLLLYRRNIDVHRGLLIFQPSQAGCWLHAQDTATRPLKLLSQYLQSFYPISHPIVLIRCASEATTRSTILQKVLMDLGESLELPSDFTLYLPPVGPPEGEVISVRNSLILHEGH